MRALGERFRVRPLSLPALCAVAGIVVADHLPAWSFWLLVSAGVASALLAWRERGVGYLLIFTAITFATLHQESLHETRAHPLFIELEKQKGPCDCVVTGRVEKALRRDMPGS